MPDEKSQSPEPFITVNNSINVDEIMSAIQNRIREKKGEGLLIQSEIDEVSDMELLPIPDFLEIPNVYEPILYPSSKVTKKEFKKFEITLENENGSGLRGLIKKILGIIRKIFFPLVRFMTRPLYNELKQFTTDRYNANAYELYLLEDYKRLVDESKEYIKLMHNTTNNLIVEISKLKIDQEMMKTKMKVLEDKIEFVENRERAIEKKMFTPSDSTLIGQQAIPIDK